MSTRARIGIVNDDFTVTSIYTHNDGYINHHGPLLLNVYNTSTKIRKLMELGSLSRLAENLGKKHNFDTSWSKHPTWCCSYARDRGYRGDQTGATNYESITVFLDYSEEYMYLFGLESEKWWVWDEDTNLWVDLLQAVVKERLTA